MNCPHCQSALGDSARFCTGCGSAVARPDLSGGDSSQAATQVIHAAPTAADVPGDPLIGRVLEDKYKITARLGYGGMGAVYRATRLRIGDEVAVKVMHPQFVKDETTLERFRREARAAALLHHPNVVAIYDYGEGHTEEAPAFIVMELVAGVSLRDLLEQHRRLGVERAVALMREICNGVGAAHRHEVIHRDIKPDNIIVLPPGAHGEHETTKVLDFGIAKLRDMTGNMTLTQAGIVMGTPYYMSPEQCRAESLDARSDVYSLGAMLYEMLAGTPPFLASTPTGVVAKHLMEPPPPLPFELRVPAPVEAVIGRSLAKDRNLRQADATAFARELQTAMTSNLTHPLAPSTRASGAAQATQIAYPPAATVRQVGAYGTAPPVAARDTLPPGPAGRSRTGMLVAGAVSLLILIALGAAAYFVFVDRKPSPGLGPSGVREPSGVQPLTPTPVPTVPTNANRPEAAGAPADARGRAESKILNNERLDKNDLAGINDADLRLLRNTVYARHGRIFDAPDLQRYFSTRPWYRPRSDYGDASLTANDRDNVALIRSAEGAGAAPPEATIRNEVTETLNGWVGAMGRHDLDAYMGYYAGTLDAYYKRGNVSRADVRADKARAFTRFATLDIRLNNVNLRADETGARVVVTFDKAYDFVEADGRHFSGSARSALWLEKSGNRWLITSEKDL